jgi:hypothetical protein
MTSSTTTVVLGQNPACLNRGGVPVVTIPSDSLPFAAWATLTDSGKSVIYWNAGRMITASPAVRMLVLLHECAHHVLGHVQKLPSNDVKQEFERQADCWAVQSLVEQEMISTVAFHETLAEIARWVGDRTHQSGPALVAILGRCLTDKTSASLWHRFLETLVFASTDSLVPIRGDLIPESGDEAVRESIVDAPGISECDIRGGHVLVCPLFQGIRQSTVNRRYQEIRTILLGWLSPAWKRIDRNQAGFHQSTLFLAWNEETGMNLALVVTESHRLFFTWSASRP